MVILIQRTIEVKAAASLEDSVSGLTGTVVLHTQSADWDQTEVPMVYVNFGANGKWFCPFTNLTVQ